MSNQQMHNLPTPVPDFWAGACNSRLFSWSLVPRTECQSVEILTDSTNTNLCLLLQLSIWLTLFYQYLLIPLTAAQRYRFSVSAYTEFKLLHLTIISYFYLNSSRSKASPPRSKCYCLQHFVLMPACRKVTQMIPTVAFAIGLYAPKSM